MRQRIKTAIIFCVGTAVICGLCFLFKYYLETSDLKIIVEKEISRFLSARVRIDQIRVGLFQHISLNDVKVDVIQKKFPILAGAKKIVFRYDLKSFFVRQFKIPKYVFLDSPLIALESFKKTGELFDLGSLSENRNFSPYFELKQGEIKLPWFVSDRKFYLNEINGKMTPVSDREFQVDLVSKLGGVAEGTAVIKGSLAPIERRLDVEVLIKDGKFSKESQLPIESLEGDLKIKEDVLQIEHLEFMFRGVLAKVEGRIEKLFSEKPLIDLTISFGQNEKESEVRIQLHLADENINGSVRLFNREYRFSGHFFVRSDGLYEVEMLVNDLYQSETRLNFKQGIFDLKLSNEPQRGDASFSIADLAGQFNFKIEHFKILGFDWVTQAIIYFAPDEKLWATGRHTFDVSLKTGYLIFQQHPMKDLEASAQVSREGIQNIRAIWGDASELEGVLNFEPKPVMDVRLQIGQIDLKQFGSFGTHPLSRSMTGTISGKVEARGPVKKPELKGSVMINHGVAGRLQYDRAEVHFQGELPYLGIEDSRVWVGKNSLILKGGLDFTLKNFVKGIQVESPEHLLIWKGLELGSEEEMMGTDKGEQIVRVGGGSNKGMAGGAKVEAEYQLNQSASIQMVAGQDKEKQEYLTLGPKMKF